MAYLPGALPLGALIREVPRVMPHSDIPELPEQVTHPAVIRGMYGPRQNCIQGGQSSITFRLHVGLCTVKRLAAVHAMHAAMAASLVAFQRHACVTAGAPAGERANGAHRRTADPTPWPRSGREEPHSDPTEVQQAISSATA